MTVAAEALDLASLAILCASPVWVACWVAYVVEQSQRSISNPDARAAYALAAGVGQAAGYGRLYREYRRRWVLGVVPHAPHPDEVTAEQARGLVK